jgi:hypothetical protein
VAGEMDIIKLNPPDVFMTEMLCNEQIFTQKRHNYCFGDFENRIYIDFQEIHFTRQQRGDNTAVYLRPITQ